MILEPKHKNFKDEYKIKVRVLKKFSIRRHMSILVVFELHYFQELLVPDRRCWVVPEVVLARRGVFGVPVIWRGEGWGEGGSKGVSLQAT